MRINGIGTTFLGVGAQDKQNIATATTWFTFIYLPIVPLARQRVQFLPHRGSGYAYRLVSREPLNWLEILRTYMMGWIVIPLILFGPFFLGLTEVWQFLGLPSAWQIIYIAAGCLWLAIAIWKLADWQEARCRPQSTTD